MSLPFEKYFLVMCLLFGCATSDGENKKNPSPEIAETKTAEQSQGGIQPAAEMGEGADEREEQTCLHEGVPVNFVAVPELLAGCSFPPFTYSATAVDQRSFQDLFGCENKLDFDFENNRLFWAFLEHRPDVTIHSVVESGGKVWVNFQAQQYCGGAAPPASMMILKLPASDFEVLYLECVVGECEGPPPP